MNILGTIMITMNEFETFQEYLSLKLHFDQGKYDYFKYGGKTSASVESFDKRRDKFKFGKLSRKLTDPEITEYFVANFIRGKKWIGDFNEKNWTEHKKINQSIEYFFENDVEKLLTNAENFDILFNSVNGNHPKIIKAYLGKKIKLETLIIFEKLLRFRKQYDEEIKEKFIWPEVSRLIQKYEPFVNIDKPTFKAIALNKISEIQHERTN